jgi:uncharacterized protein (DUF433 family)
MNKKRDYVWTDESGVMRLGNSRVMLDSVVAAFQQGHSPETISQQYPALSLEEVYGAITYYLAHADEVDEYLKKQDALWTKLRAESEGKASPVVARLRALKHSKFPELA